MEQSVDLAALEREVGRIDPEVFRRVWARVMPDQSNSPLVVHGPPVPEGKKRAAQAPAPVKGSPGQQPPAPARESRAQQPPARESMEMRPGGEEPGAALVRLMDLSREGVERGTALARRAGNRERGLSALAGDHRQGLRRLSALYFLTTGRRHQPPAPPPGPTLPLDLALRDQFLWEERWRSACLEAAQGAPEAAGELCRELAEEAAYHRRIIRGILERM